MYEEHIDITLEDNNNVRILTVEMNRHMDVGVLGIKLNSGRFWTAGKAQKTEDFYGTRVMQK